MSLVRALGYLGFYSTSIERWAVWATELLGLQVVDPPPTADRDHLRLRMDERSWRLAVELGEIGGLAFTGWEVSDARALEELGNALEDAGTTATSDSELARSRKVEALVRCKDPDGFQLEFFYGALTPNDSFVSPLGTSFVTGDLGMGHILLSVSDLEATKTFYIGTLDFRLSDIIEFGTRPNRVHFTRVNRRHHSLAFFEPEDRQPALGHFMIETTDLDAVGRALDRVHSGMAELTETLGRHTNDQMVSFYMMNPSGSQTEYGWGGRLVDEQTWTVTKYHSTAYWGHKLPQSEYAGGGPISPRELAPQVGATSHA